MTVSLFGLDLPVPGFGLIVFAMLSLVAILSGVMMITRRNAVHAALWLVVAFFQLAGLYVMLGAEFLAALQVLVYTGAILVLFLFVIMLLNLREHSPSLGGTHAVESFIAWPVGIVLMLELITVILFSNPRPAEAFIDKFSTTFIAQMGGNIQALGQTLYTTFLFPFEVASLILLLAVLGAIVLARKEEPAEVEEVVPTVGISLGRRSVSDSPQEVQLEKKLRPAIGQPPAPDATAVDRETPVVSQPSGVGAGTTSGAEADRTPTAGAGK